MPESNRKVKGTIHWVTTKHAFEAEVRLYDRLFNVENPNDKRKVADFIEALNHDALKIITAYVEPWLKNAKPLQNFQFQRIGYFNVDPDSVAEKLVFNRTVALKVNY